MHSETEGKLTLQLVPSSKDPHTDWPIERAADLKLILKWHSEETRIHQDAKKTSEVGCLPKMLDLICMIIYNVFLTSWTFAYKANVFYHAHNPMLCCNTIIGFVANYLCLVILNYLGGFLHSTAVVG